MEDVPPKTRVSRNLLVWVFALVVIILAVGFFIFSEPAISPTDEGESFGVLPDEVEVIGDGKDIIIFNKERDYKVTVGEEWEILQVGDSLVIDNLKNKVDGSSGVGGEGCRVVISSTPINELNSFVKNKCDGDLDCDDFKIEPVSEQISSVVFFGSFMGSGEKEFYLAPDASPHTYDRLTIICSDDTNQIKYEQQILSSFRRGK